MQQTNTQNFLRMYQFLRNMVTKHKIVKILLK